MTHEWGLEKGKPEASLPVAKSVERLFRSHDLVTQLDNSHHCTRP